MFADPRAAAVEVDLLAALGAAQAARPDAVATPR
jgi:hypothetical protein